MLNRISFSGTVDSGGYSEGAFRGRFTDSSIARLISLGTLLQGVKITNQDYTQLLYARGDNVFLFLDPPYLVATRSRLYGLNGTLHTSFDHQKFANEMQRCEHQWLITYDDSSEIRTNFSFAFQDEWQLQYGMNNYKRATAAKGNELFLSNYVQQPHRVSQLALMENKKSYRTQKKVHSQ